MTTLPAIPPASSLLTAHARSLSYYKSTLNGARSIIASLKSKIASLQRQLSDARDEVDFWRQRCEALEHDSHIKSLATLHAKRRLEDVTGTRLPKGTELPPKPEAKGKGRRRKEDKKERRVRFSNDPETTMVDKEVRTDEEEEDEGEVGDREKAARNLARIILRENELGAGGEGNDCDCEIARAVRRLYAARSASRWSLLRFAAVGGKGKQRETPRLSTPSPRETQEQEQQTEEALVIEETAGDPARRRRLQLRMNLRAAGERVGRRPARDTMDELIQERGAAIG